MFNFIKGVIQLAIFGAVVTGGFIGYFNYYGLPSSNKGSSSSKNTYASKLDYQQEVTFEDSTEGNIIVKNTATPSNTIKTVKSKRVTKETTNKKASKSYKRCDRLVMYSTTWCGACKSMRKKLNDRKIRYKDNVVDKNRTMDNIFRRKMKMAGRKISYPTMEINGKIVDYKSVQYYQSNYNLCEKK